MLTRFFLIFISYNFGEHNNEAVSTFEEVVDVVEKIYVGIYYDECKDDLEFENRHREEIRSLNNSIKQAFEAGKKDYFFEVNGTWATVTFPKN